MRVRLLGGLVVEGVPERDLGSRKARTLLKVLALARGNPVPAGHIADVLWGDDPPARVADQVGVLVSRLRRVLGTGRLLRTDAGYALVADWLDVEEVAALATVAAAALAEGRTAAARAAAGAALALARGPLLPGEDGTWVEAERAAVEAAVARARAVAVDAALAAGDHGAAAALAEEGLAHDPYDEAALRSLMRAHVAAGRPASALSAYARVKERLAEDLGVPPTPETEEVHDLALAAVDRPTGDGAPRPVALAGRSRELAALDAALAASASAAQAVAVRGPAGIGKSALVAAWCAARATEVTVFVGRCDALGRDLPLQPILDALGPAALGPEEPVLGPVDAGAGRLRLFAQLLDAVGRPAVVVVEDVHQADASTLAWLIYALRRGTGLLVVTTSRADGQPLPGATVLDLGPLDVDAVAEVVGADCAAEVHARTGGHPLLVAGLAGASSVQEAVDDAVGRLGADAEEVVRVAAVLGDDVDVDLLAAVVGRPPVEVLGLLEPALAAGLLVERGAALASRHDLVREALEAGVRPARRALLHRQAAEVLAARPGGDPLAVAVHARAGGLAGLASRAFAGAAAAALARFDVDAARQHADDAVAAERSADALAARARLRMALQELDVAASDATAAIAAGGGAAALEVAGWIAYYRRRYDDAGRFAEEGAATAGDDAALRASCVALAGRARHGAGDLVEAVARLEDAYAGPAVTRPVAAVWLAGARLHEGRPADALGVLDGALADAVEPHPFVPLHGRFARVVALAELGRPVEALAAAGDLDAAVARAGAFGARFVGVAANLRGWVLRWTGRLDEADDVTRIALEQQALTEPHWVAQLDLADGRLLAGDVDGAAAMTADLASMETWTGTMAWHQRHRLELLRARLALLAGEREEAEARAAAVAADAASRGARRYEWLAAVLAGAARGAAADHDALVPAVEGLRTCAGLDGWRSVAELAATTGAARWRAEAERSAAALVTAAGDASEATARLVTRVLGTVVGPSD